MRKFSFIVITVLTFLLAGCEFIPSEYIDDVKKITEDYCVENPESPACQLDADGLQNELIANTTEETFLKVKEKANKSNCKLVINPDNEELINACSGEGEQLIPETIESFLPIRVESNETSFTVIGATQNQDEFVKITVEIVEIDGQLFIDRFELGEVFVDDMYVYLSPLEAETALRNYFKDYNDSSITNETFINTYFEGMAPEGFAENRDLRLLYEVTLELKSVDLNGDGMLDIVTTETRKLDGHDTKRPGRINYRSVGEVTVTWYDGIDDDCNLLCYDYEDDLTKAEEFYQAYFADFQNKDISNEDLEMKYFDFGIAEDILNERKELLENNGMIQNIVVTAEENGYLVTYEVLFGDDIIIRKRPGRIRKRPDLLLQEWDSLIEDN